MIGAELLVKALEKNTEYIFAYPGAANCPIIDALSKSKIKTILTRGEQAAAHSASGYSKASGKVGVCCVTSGPGATNIITGIANAYMDSIPIVIITGQVSTDIIGKDAFQEVDITGATLPFTKHSYLVKDQNELEAVVKEAFYLARTGRPGPVLIDIPIDIQTSAVSKKLIVHDMQIRGYKYSENPNELQVKRAASALKASKRPLIMVGGGAVNSSFEVTKLLRDNKIPVVSTMNGLGTVLTKTDGYFGMVGEYGVKAANEALKNSDLLITLGARLGNRSFGNVDLPKTEQNLIHVDIDPAEIGKSVIPHIPIVGDVKNFCTSLINLIGDYKSDDKWIDYLKSIEVNGNEIENEDFVNPKRFIRCLSDAVSDMYVTTDVGQHQIWTVNNLDINFNRQLIMSAGLGTMGFGIPSAIGARAATGKGVIAIVGDGSFQMDFQELATIKQWDLPIKVVVMKNNCLGMVRELQKNEYNKNYCCVALDGSPDFCKIADAYGIKSSKISNNSEIKKAISDMLSDDMPYVLEVSVSGEESSCL